MTQIIRSAIAGIVCVALSSCHNPDQVVAANHAVAFLELIDSGRMAEAYILLSSPTRRRATYAQFLDQMQRESTVGCERYGPLETTQIDSGGQGDARFLWGWERSLVCRNRKPVREQIVVALHEGGYQIWAYRRKPGPAVTTSEKAVVAGARRSEIDAVKRENGRRLAAMEESTEPIDEMLVRKFVAEPEPLVCRSAPRRRPPKGTRLAYFGTARFPEKFHSFFEYSCAYSVFRNRSSRSTEGIILTVKDGEIRYAEAGNYGLTPEAAYLIVRVLPKK